MKYLLLIAFAVLVYWLLKRSKPADGEPTVPPEPDKMVRCAHCGVYLPSREAIGDGERSFCCERHRQLGAPE